MLLIVGLGNPGGKHARNRHNVGFMALDAIHDRNSFGPWRKRFQAETAEGKLGGEQVLLVKPQTYMNVSGNAVGEAAHFFKIEPQNIVVIHDEVDLPPGKIRMKTGGGVAGHNGLRSIRAAIGEDFRRLRIGVGHPGNKELVPGYVLHDFAKADAEWLTPLLDAIAANAGLLAQGKDNTFANRLHEGEKGDSDKQRTAETAAPRESRPGKPEPAGKTGEGPLARGLKKLFGPKD